jgi:hypothetical protein
MKSDVDALLRDAAKIAPNHRSTLTRLRRVAEACQSRLEKHLAASKRPLQVCSEENYASVAAEMGDDENGNRLCGAARKWL